MEKRCEADVSLEQYNEENYFEDKRERLSDEEKT